MDGSPNVTWHEGTLSRARRWQALDTSGATVWLTGLPASGKPTIGAAIEDALVAQRRLGDLLDGDNLRRGICADLGLGPPIARPTWRRVGELAELFADSGAVAIVALVTGRPESTIPYEPPSQPELRLTPETQVDAAVRAVLDLLPSD